MRTHRLSVVLLIAGVVLSGWLARTPGAASAAQGEACFAETGQCIRGRFLDYWQTNGGLARNGFPLSEERRELLEDGNEYTVQYFERVRLELHPENAPPYDVLLGQFGRRIVRTGARSFTRPVDTAPAAPVPGQAYFAETGHNLGGPFLDYWQRNGGLAQFGFPLSEEAMQRLEDNREYMVQYFERARFELHPENAAPYDVLLGQFGRQILAENDLLAGTPGFQRIYLTNEHLQASLGRPSEQMARAPGAYQGFERGAMVYRSDVRRIAVFCGDERSGRAFASRPFVPHFPDTYQEGEPVGGGAGPRPGTYEPRFGFGKLWRERADIRDCLGYATTAEETTGTVREQAFDGGFMLGATTPAGRIVYARYFTADGYRYERYPDPAS